MGNVNGNNEKIMIIVKNISKPRITYTSPSRFIFYQFLNEEMGGRL